MINDNAAIYSRSFWYSINLIDIGEKHFSHYSDNHEGDFITVLELIVSDTRHARGK